MNVLGVIFRKSNPLLFGNYLYNTEIWTNLVLHLKYVQSKKHFPGTTVEQ